MSLLQFRDSCKRLGGMGRPADLGGNIIAVVGEKTRMIMSFMIDLPWAGGGSGGEGGGEMYIAKVGRVVRNRFTLFCLRIKFSLHP